MRLAAWLAGVALWGSLSGCVEGAFFYPDRVTYTTPAELGVVARDVSIPGPAGHALHGWWLEAEAPSSAVVLHLHGNAANVSNHLPLVAWLPREGFDVLMVDYRGFGRSGGKPSLDGVVDDALAALAWLRAQAPARPIVVLGQSLGGATALRAVARDRAGVKLVIVDAAFASYRGIARDAMGVLGWAVSPVLFGLPSSEHDPLSAIAKIGVPVLVLHGSSDGVIPIAHGRALHAAAREPKQWIEVEGGDHLDSLLREPVRRRVVDAIRRALAP
jgi:fermentation-respiration switch protein FrsA (DUF1100 family)